VKKSAQIAFSNLVVAGVRKDRRELIPVINDGFQNLSIEQLAKLEAGNKTLAFDVLSNFSAGDTLVVSGPKFTNFSASSANYMGLDIYNSGIKYASDNKIISVSVSGNAYLGGSGDGWSYATRPAATF